MPGDWVTPILFYALAALTVVSAWAIVLSQNIVRMAVYLLLTLVGVAGLYFMLQAEFLAAVQLIVYAGGTLILIVFGVMLTSSNPAALLKTSSGERLLGLVIALIAAGTLLLALSKTPSLIASDTQPPDYRLIDRLGKTLLTTYLVPFEVAGVLLLVVMIGAAYLARRRERRG